MRYKVMRDCCTSGNCTTCSKHGAQPTPPRVPARVEHGTYSHKTTAEAVAFAWLDHNASVEVIAP